MRQAAQSSEVSVEVICLDTGCQTSERHQLHHALDFFSFLGLGAALGFGDFFVAVFLTAGALAARVDKQMQEPGESAA